MKEINLLRSSIIVMGVQRYIRTSSSHGVAIKIELWKREQTWIGKK